MHVFVRYPYPYVHVTGLVHISRFNLIGNHYDLMYLNVFEHVLLELLASIQGWY